jgi:hypothetical protein
MFSFCLATWGAQNPSDNQHFLWAYPIFKRLTNPYIYIDGIRENSTIKYKYNITKKNDNKRIPHNTNEWQSRCSDPGICLGTSSKSWMKLGGMNNDGDTETYPLVNCPSLLWKDPPFLMERSNLFNGKTQLFL